MGKGFTREFHFGFPAESSIQQSPELRPKFLAVGREYGRNVGPEVYTVGVRDVKVEIPDEKEGAKMPEYRIRVAPNTVAYADAETHKLVVEFAIPGAPTDTIDVKILEDSLHLTAPARDIEYVSALALGWPVKPYKAEATYEHGLLRIEVPIKDPMEDAVKVTIKAGGAETKAKAIKAGGTETKARTIDVRKS